MDEPVSGLRLSDDELRIVRAICLHAEQALETARSNAEGLKRERIGTVLLTVAPLMPQCSTELELAALACDTAIMHLGFEAAAIYLSDGDSLRRCDSRGWAPEAAPPERLAFQHVESVLVGDMEQAGCWLIPARDLFPGLPQDFHSPRNGRGPSGWKDGVLLAPARNEDDSLRTLLVLDDPVDNQLPSDQQRRVLRLLVEQTSAAQKLIEQRAELAHLASHDPLTGLRNRRGLDALLSAHSQVALLVCDLDRFKQINDRYGHAVGDQVLQRFGELLYELARSTDVAIRLGGEEFCLVLPQTARGGALNAAERLRLAVQERMTDLVAEGVTVSIGVAATADGVLDASALLALADRGMYAAKQAGGNRSEEAG
jgi:diguanylate cyclase (GGDEF)-like protein